MFEYKVEVSYGDKVTGRVEKSIEFMAASNQEEAASRIIAMYKEYGHKILKLQLLDSTKIFKPEPKVAPLGRPKKAMGRRIPTTVQLSDELLRELDPYVVQRREAGEHGYSRSDFIYVAMYEMMEKVGLIK